MSSCKLLSSAIFAKEISFNLSVPLQFENILQNGITSKTFMTSAAFVVYRNEKFLFTVSPGIHGGFLFSDGNSLSLTYMFGLGGNLRTQISFSDSGYFNFGTTVIYNLYGMDIDENSGKMNTWTVSPKIGVGFIF